MIFQLKTLFKIGFYDEIKLHSLQQWLLRQCSLAVTEITMPVTTETGKLSEHCSTSRATNKPETDGCLCKPYGVHTKARNTTLVGLWQLYPYHMLKTAWCRINDP